MPILLNLPLDIRVEQVLRAQGADPEIIKKRRPKLVRIAEQALEQGTPLLEPKVLYEEYAVSVFKHETITLSNGKKLKGELIAQHLPAASKVILMLSSIGSTLEEYSTELMKTSPVIALALEGVGSAAVEELANLACNHFEKMALEKDQQSTLPLSPGMIGWTVKEGQKQIFSILNNQEIGVRLNKSSLMLPRKTLSLVIGIGENVVTQGNTCDFYALRENCKYQDHYTKTLQQSN